MEDKKSFYEKEREKAEWRKAKKEELLQEIRGNTKMMDYLSGYAEDDTQKFIDRYAEEKVKILEWAPRFAQWKENQELQWVEDAMERLAEIQQKKLFDIQCLWRAESIQIDGVEIAYDFRRWEEKILNCPFIDPVSEEDIELYQRYLQSNNFEHQQGWLESWQDYDDIKAAYQSGNANRNFPEWYDFHNGLTGKGVLLSLPNVRGEKEDYYIRLACEEEKKEREEKAASRAPAPPALPSLTYYESGFMEWFVITFETKETQTHFFDYGGDRIWDKTEEEEENDEVQKWVDFLSKEGEVFPIRGWYDWREGLERCVEDYRRYKIAEALPAAYEQYCMYRASGMSFPEEHNRTWDSIGEMIMKRILKGRKLCGEPENLDF